MVKKLISLLLIITFAIPLPSWAEDAEADTKTEFADVSNDYYAYDAIMDLAQRGIVNGKSETLFFPEDSIKREELAKILTNAFSLKEVTEGIIFNDVPAGTWYAKHVISIAASGLVEGVSENLFGTGQQVSRQDLAVILKRFLDKEGVSLETENSVIFADNNEISDYAKDAVLLLTSNGIITAKENNLFYPKSYVTRADAALAIVNAEKAKREYHDRLGRMGADSQYDPPYDVPTDDRLAQAKPVPFNPSNQPAKELVFEDFNDADFNGGVKYGTANYNADGGYDGTKCMKIEDHKIPNIRYDMKPGVVQAGDFILLTGKVRAEKLTGSGYFTVLVTIYDQDGVWLGEGYGTAVKTEGDWVEVSAIRQVKEVLNDLNPPTSYKIGLGMYMSASLEGIFYGDDFRASVVQFDPIDTVLMAPAYKGIIKGEGGKGDIALRTYVHDGNGYYDLNDLRIVTQITDDDNNVLLESVTDNVTKVMDIYFSSETLPMGKDFYLDSIVYQKSTGEKIQSTQWLLHKRESDFTTVVDFDEYGRVLYNGVPRFMTSYYASGGLESWKDYFIDAPGLDGATLLGYIQFGFGKSERYQGLIKDFVDNGKTLSIPTGTMYMDGGTTEVKKRIKNQDDLRGLLTKLTKNFRDLPNLFGYYLYDEVNGARYGEEQNWARKIIESVDLDHPTLCAIDNYLPSRPGVYAKTSDFLGLDPYPVTGKEDQDIAKVYNTILDARKKNPGRPVYPVLQGFHYYNRGDLRQPTEEEFRNMTFQAIIAGACMLDVYGFYHLYTYLDRERFDFEEVWNSYMNVFKEVKFFEPTLLSIEPAPHYELKGCGDWLKHMSKRNGDKSYLFTVNTSQDLETGRIYLDGVDTIKGLYSGKTYKADKNGWFDISWNKYETEVFEYSQADYKSPHAEIKRFGLVGHTMLDAEGDAYYVIDKNTSKAAYVACISDFATLYINGEKVDLTGEIDLSGKTEIKVKAVSEDERFATEKVLRLVEKEES